MVLNYPRAWQATLEATRQEHQAEQLDAQKQEFYGFYRCLSGLAREKYLLNLRRAVNRGGLYNLFLLDSIEENKSNLLVYCGILGYKKAEAQARGSRDFRRGVLRMTARGFARFTKPTSKRFEKDMLAMADEIANSLH